MQLNHTQHTEKQIKILVIPSDHEVEREIFTVDELVIVTITLKAVCHCLVKLKTCISYDTAIPILVFLRETIAQKYKRELIRMLTEALFVIAKNLDTS